MRRIVGRLQPFDRTQRIYVYEDGNTLEVVDPKTENVVQEILNLAEKYQVVNVSLAGPKQYNRGLAKQIAEKAENDEYNNKNSLVVTII